MNNEQTKKADFNFIALKELISLATYFVFIKCIYNKLDSFPDFN